MAFSESGDKIRSHLQFMIVIAKLSQSTDICSSILNSLSCMEIEDFKGSFFMKNYYNRAILVHNKYGLFLDFIIMDFFISLQIYIYIFENKFVSFYTTIRSFNPL